MITFKNYLQLFEDPDLPPNVSIPWEATDLIPSQVNAEFVLKHCSDSLNDLENGKILFRGDGATSSPFKIINTAKSKRSSKDTNNLYQLIMDTSENMKDVPSRSNSIISSSNHSVALAYGKESPMKTYLILPFNGTKIACFKHADIFNALFESEKLAFRELVSHNKLTNFFADVIGEKTLTSKTDVRGLFNNADLAKIVFFWDFWGFSSTRGGLLDFSKLGTAAQQDYKTGDLGESISYISRSNNIGSGDSEFINKVFGFMRENNFASASPRMDEFIKLMKDGSNDYFKALSSEIAKSEQMGITVEPVGSLTVGKRNECWFSGKCLTVRFDYVKALIKELEDKLGKKFTGFDYIRPYFS